MREQWEKQLACLIVCPRCAGRLETSDDRILSVYDHEPICMSCKKEEEKRPDYPERSKQMIEQWMSESEINYGDLAGFCYHHFNVFKC